MMHRSFSSATIALAAVAVLAWFTSPAAAQRGRGQGQGNWGQGQGNWGNGRGYSNGYYDNGTSGYGADNWGQYNSDSGAAGQDANSVRFSVHVPPDAQVMFDGDKTQQRGELRRFVSPPLDRNKTFTYEIKASWTENGRKVERTRTVQVHGGQSVNVDFMTMNNRGDENTDRGMGTNEDMNNGNRNDLDRNRTDMNRDRNDRVPGQQNDMRRDKGDRDNKDNKNVPTDPNDKDRNKPPMP